MGWHHQAGHAYTHLLERLESFDDDLPVAVTITMEDATGVEYTSSFRRRPGDFLEQLREELQEVRERGD